MALNGSSIFSEISVLENESDFSLKLTASPSSKVRDYWQLKVKLNYACKFYIWGPQNLHETKLYGKNLVEKEIVKFCIILNTLQPFINVIVS